MLSKPGFAEEAVPLMDSVFRFAMRLCAGDEDEAADLLQDTYLKAYRAWDTYDRGSNCHAWLLTICRNTFLRGRQRDGRRAELEAIELATDAEGTALLVAEPPAESANPERAFFDSFVDAEILTAIERMPPEFREPLILSDIEGLSYADIANVLGLPLGTVKSRLFRGRRFLQESLHDYAAAMGYVGGDRS